MAFGYVKQEMQFSAGVDHFIGDLVLRLIVKLALGDDIAPLQVVLLIEGEDHDIFRVEACGIGAAVAPGIVVGAVIVRGVKAGAIAIGVHVIPAVEHTSAGGGVQGLADDEVAAVFFGHDVFDEEVIEGCLHAGIGAFGQGAQFVGKYGDLLIHPGIGGLVPDDRIKSFYIPAPLFVVKAGEDVPLVVV